MAANENVNASPGPSLRFTFHKTERLSRKKLIDELFNNGNSFYSSPFRVHFQFTSLESPFPAQVLITVPLKNFRHATDRNRIKRLIREAYRLNKHILYDFLTSSQRLLIAFVYSEKKMVTFELINQKMISVLKRLSRYGIAEENRG